MLEKPMKRMRDNDKMEAEKLLLPRRQRKSPDTKDDKHSPAASMLWSRGT